MSVRGKRSINRPLSSVHEYSDGDHRGDGADVMYRDPEIGLGVCTCPAFRRGRTMECQRPNRGSNELSEPDLHWLPATGWSPCFCYTTGPLEHPIARRG